MEIIVGIASTTHVDRHRERMAKSALDSMALQINEKFIPALLDHNLNSHGGVVLYSEVFQLTDGEHALGIVSGVFENESEKEKFKSGQANDVWEEYKKYLDTKELSRLHAENSKLGNDHLGQNNSKLNTADLLEIHLDSTQVLPDGTVYKIKKFIAATGDLKIEIYPKDHKPAHFHVISKQRSINARFSLETLELINMKQGAISNTDIKKIQNFFLTHPQDLKKLKSEHGRMQT